MPRFFLLLAIFTIASWYNYSLPNWPNAGAERLTTASRDYPRGTKLQVCRTTPKKPCVIVWVNDYGPEVKKYPERGLDLSLRAFRALANPKVGLIQVEVTEL